MLVKRGHSLIHLFSILLAVCTPVVANSAGPQSRLLSAIGNDQTAVVSNNTPRVVSSGVAIDQGSAPRNQTVPRLVLHFTMTTAQHADLVEFLQALQDRRSPQYHKFLTPEQYADRFGLGNADIEKISRWLENSGFHSLQVARSRSWISFSGTVAHAESAFHTSIHRYSIRGEQHWSNASDPSVPKALEGLVESVRGLHNIPLRPSLIHLHPNFTSSLSETNYLAPYDWATIYDVQPLYTAGLDGSGVSIAIVGQSDVHLANIQSFRAAAGLSVNTPTVIVPPGDINPGYQSASGDETESYLDLEWAGGIAKNATILFVTASATSGNGVEDAITYAIDNNIAPIVSESYGECEPQETTSDFNTQTSLFQQANAQGMTIVASSGDAGAAACDQGVTESEATLGLAVNFPASSPYVTGIGGTEFSDIGGNYWSSSNNASGGSALSYIPEAVWNDTFQSASGGGASTLVTTKPSWQTGTGVPNDGVRDVPDLAFSASPEHVGYLICESGGCTNGFRDSSNNLDVIGGTSAGAPSFAGLLALVIQQKGASTRLGNINPNLYSLAQISSDAFHDITSGSNLQNCSAGTPNCPTGSMQIGYIAGTGYDQTTGLGSLDGYNFAQQWYGDFQISASPATVTVQPGASATTTVNVVPQNNFSGNVTFSCSVSGNLIGITCSVPSAPVGPSGSVVVTVSASNIAGTPRALKPSVPFIFNAPALPVLPPSVLTLLGLLFVAVPLAVPRAQGAFRLKALYAIGAASLVVVAFGAVSCGGGASATTVTYGGGTTTTTTTVPSVLSISCNIPGVATLGSIYSGSCTATGGTAPYSYSTFPALPPGLTLNATTGAISGTPTNDYDEIFQFAVMATDSSSPTQTVTSANQKLVVTNSSPTTLTCSLPPATSGEYYASGVCTATGGNPGYAFSISAGALPAGLSLVYGQVTGVPMSAGTTSFTVEVSDSSSNLGLPTETATFPVTNFVVLPGPLTLNCDVVSNAEVRIALTGACSGKGGTLPYRYSVNSGNFPPGLTLNPSSGAISGVPVSAGTYTGTIELVDSGSPVQTTTQQVIFIVEPFQQLSCGIAPPVAPSNPQVGVYYRGYPCYAVGGIAPYSYSLTGNVPPGLSIGSGSGMVTGTPTQAGTYAFNAVVTDSESPAVTITNPITNFVVSGAETGTVTVTATSGGIVNSTTIAVSVTQ